MFTSTSISKISVALLQAQKKMGGAAKGASNPYFKSKYADLGSVMEVVKDPLNDAGIIILQPVSSRDGSHYVQTVLLHESGESISSEPLKLELSKTDMQNLGSAITYARRYTLQSLLSIPAEDDDGETAMGRKSKKVEAEKPTTNKHTTQVVAPSSIIMKLDNPNTGITGAVLVSPPNSPAILSVTEPAITPLTQLPPPSKTTFRKSAPKLNF